MHIHYNLLVEGPILPRFFVFIAIQYCFHVSVTVLVLVNRVGKYTDILGIPQYQFDIDYDVKYRNTIFRPILKSAISHSNF